MNDAVKQIITDLLEDFKDPASLNRIAAHVIPRDDRPCGKWSFLNRWIVLRAKTEDARGYRQWSQIGRQVKNGVKALYILVPLLVEKKVKDKNGADKIDKILIGFKRFPVFRVEDTEGEPVNYPDWTPKQMPPLMNVAKTWGLDVKWGPNFFQPDGTLGTFSAQTGEIHLMSQDVNVFFHELAHAGHQKVTKNLQAMPQREQEIVAEFAAAILVRLYGFKGEGNAYDYISQYAEGHKNPDVLKACTRVLSLVEKIVREIVAVETGEDTADGSESV